MEILGIAIIVVFLVLMMTDLILLCSIIKKCEFRWNFEIDFDGKDDGRIEPYEDPCADIKESITIANSEAAGAHKVKYSDENNDSLQKPKKEIPFWDNLPALLEEQERLEIQGFQLPDGVDALDHSRNVAERIVQLRESQMPIAG